MAEIQVSSPVLAASAGQGASAGGAAPVANGFFAQALAGSMAASTPVAGAGPALAAAQPVFLNIPAAFLLSSAGAQPGVAAAAQAAEANPLLAPLTAGGEGASALFDDLVSQLAALGAGGGDPRQVRSQLAALGFGKTEHLAMLGFGKAGQMAALGGGDVKQLLAKLAVPVGDGAELKALEDMLGQVAQALSAGQMPDSATLGALAAQLQAFQGVVATGDGKAEKAADIAASRKALPAIASGGPSAGGGAVGAAASAGTGSGAALSGQANFAAYDHDSGAARAASEPLLVAKAGVGEGFAAASDMANLLSPAPLPVQAGGETVRLDGFSGVVAAGVPKVAQDVAAQEALLVRTPIRAPGWDADFSQKVIWMVGRESQSAQLVLNPPQLGTVEVRLTMSGGEAGAQFFSPHQGVREAIETALPRLRDMMAEAGLSLGQASVSSESFRDQRANGGDAARMAGLPEEDESKNTALVSSSSLSSHIAQGRGLVDLYA